MEQDARERESEPRTENEPSPWQPTNRQVLWVIGTGLILETLAFLVAKLDLGIWQHLSQQRIATFIGIVVAVMLLIVMLALGGASLGWTGFGERKLWDWLHLLGTLAIPVVVAVAAAWFSSQQSMSQSKIAAQNAQEEALQAYLSQMSTLLLDENLRNPKEDEDMEVRSLARARTLSVLERLDPDHKERVMQFLMEDDLVQGIGGRDPVIGLKGADLKGTDLTKATLSGADLTEANLRDADLTDADLSGADLPFAVLRDVDLSGARVTDANLSGAKGVTKERLEQAASLGGTTGPDGKPLPSEPAPLKPGPLSPGIYKANDFKPALRFEVGTGWGVLAPITADNLNLIATGSEVGQEGQVNFTRPLQVVDPSSLSEAKSAPNTVDEWAAWFQAHPYLDTSDPIRMSVGGASGVSINVIAISPPASSTGFCRDLPCVPLYAGSTIDSVISSYVGVVDRFVILDVGGETVIIDVAATVGKFDQFAPKAQKILKTVEWNSE
jgi:uncharacterized protein YjbI with pentapeptide repeats